MKSKIASPLAGLAMTILIVFFSTGCIRLTGSAGYWKKGSEEEASTGKSVGFDTDDLVYPDRPKGSITYE